VVAHAIKSKAKPTMTKLIEIGKTTGASIQQQ